jgi:ATP-dependent Clp protease protease subunit
LIREKLNRVLSHHTGQTLKKVQSDTDRDNFLSATDAVTYGLIDQVLTDRSTIIDRK